MLLHDAPADSKTEAGPTFVAGIGGINLLKALEDRLQLVCRDAATLVAHADEQACPPALGGENDGAAGFGKLDRVAEQIRQSLRHAIAIGIDRTACGTNIQADVVSLGHSMHGCAGLGDEIGSVQGLDIKRNISRFDSLD